MLNLGNTSLFGGVFSDEKLLVQFRVPIETVAAARSFEKLFGVRVRGPIDRMAFCSVVPSLTAKVARFLQRHFVVAPQILQVGSPHGLKIGYRRPQELGTDRLAAALGARKFFPRKNAIVIDCGTATTVTAVGRDGTLRGGAILPGLALWPAALATRTAQLPAIALRRPRAALGRSTAENLQSGIFHGHAGAIRELARRIRIEAFGRADAVVIGTGGHAAKFSAERLFDKIVPEIVLVGLNDFARQNAGEGL